MPVEYKDYYKTLGVDRKASHDDIRKAFRSLARQYHPDVAKDKKHAEEKFKEINEAYEVLGDADKRKKYDDLGADWASGFVPHGHRQAGPEPYQSYTHRSGNADEGFEFSGTGFSDFFERFFGGEFDRRGGSTQRDTEKGRDVEGVLMVTLEEAMRGAVRSVSIRHNGVCDECHGTGAKGRSVCPVCHGSGQVTVTHEHKVKIPPGVRDGQRLRLAGKGEDGTGGGPPGDLYLRVRMASHPDFRVEGGDLYYDLDLAPWEAALGASISVPTLTDPVNIKIPAGTQTGQRLRVKSRGLPGRDTEKGDLYVVARVQVPKESNEREKDLWGQLARESRFNPRN
jgi:curved DNA-binding protein